MKQSMSHHKTILLLHNIFHPQKNKYSHFHQQQHHLLLKLVASNHKDLLIYHSL
ncbi:MAG: hypothetical protein VZQ98_11835 [Bacteroidales bacterium]|nr:hypothetical protein [Bacteroidales bacterium]